MFIRIEKQKIKLFFFKTIAVLFALTVAVLCMETAMRLGGYTPAYINPLRSFHVKDSLIGWKGKKNFTGRFKRPSFDAIIKQDSQGYRLHEFDHPEATKRIIVFGDSFTWGWGVGQGKVFTDRMNPELPDYRIINRGINGSGTVMQYALFQDEWRDAIGPDDTAIIAFFHNDLEDNATASKDRLYAKIEGDEIVLVPPQAETLAHPLWATIKSGSYFINFLDYSLNVLKQNLKKNAIVRNAIFNTDPLFLRDAQTITRHFLNRFQEDCREREARFIVVLIPDRYEIGEGNGETEERIRYVKQNRAAFVEIAHDLGISYLDLQIEFLDFKSKHPETMLTIPGDGHWSEEGHALAAKAIAEFIRS